MDDIRRSGWMDELNMGGCMDTPSRGWLEECDK